MDSKFQLFIHGNPRLVDIVDQEWTKQRLDFDEIQVPIEEQPALENVLDDEYGINLLI